VAGNWDRIQRRLYLPGIGTFVCCCFPDRPSPSADTDRDAARAELERLQSALEDLRDATDRHIRDE